PAQKRHVPVSVRLHERRYGLAHILRQATQPPQDPYPNATTPNPPTHQRAVRHAAGSHLLSITPTSGRSACVTGWTTNIHAPPGTTGQVENCQVTVYLAYTTPRAHALIDHRLYLPASWTGDEHRRTSARAPESVEFATKPELARQMLATAVQQVPDGRVA